MARADALALSSRWEGLSCVLVEALALGTPVVAADCPSGPREILQDGKYGSLIPVDDHEAMAERLVRILADPPPREFLQQAAQPFEVGRAADAYLEAMGIGNVDARERTPHPSGCRPH
jgi:glycosyltransferase involved in cell wall biosynthesis